MWRLLVMILAFMARFSPSQGISQGSFALPYTATMKLGYFMNADKMTDCGNKSPFTEDARNAPLDVMHESSSFLFKTVSSSKEKRDLLNIKGSLSLKIKALNGIDISASGEYLKDKVESSSFVEILAVIKISKGTKTLTRQSEKQSGYLDMVKNAVEAGCMHYVRSVEYGGELIISLRFTANEKTDIEDIKAQASLEVRASAVDVSVEGQFRKLAKDLEKTSSFEASLYQVGGSGGDVVTTVDEMLGRLEKFISEFNNTDDEGVPIRVTVVPVENIVPNDKVTTAMRFITNRALEASTNRFEQYYDDVVKAENIVKIITDMLAEGKGSEHEDAANELGSIIGKLANEFRKVIQKMTLNQDSSITESDNFAESLDSYATSLTGGDIPWKYSIRARTLLDMMKGKDVAESVPQQLLKELERYLLMSLDEEESQTHFSKLKCTYKELKKDGYNVMELTSSAGSVYSLAVPGFAMNVYSDAESIPADTPITFARNTVEDEIDASLNLETVAPTTSRRDYYRSKVMGVKTRLSKILTGKRKRKGMYRDETKVSLFQDGSNVVAPMDGVYILSYNLYNRGDVTEVIATNPCSTGWTPHKDRCYKKGTNTENFQAAQNDCTSQSATLAEIEDQADNDLVKRLAGGAKAWIGLRRDSKGQFSQWLSGKSTSYTNWNGGEPNNSGGNEYYTEMFSDGKWNDILNYNRVYVCMRDTNKAIEAKGKIQVRVKKGSDDLSTQLSRSATENDEAGSECGIPAQVLPISKPVLAKLNAADKVHLEQSVAVEKDEGYDNFFSGVLLTGASVE